MSSEFRTTRVKPQGFEIKYVAMLDALHEGHVTKQADDPYAIERRDYWNNELSKDDGPEVYLALHGIWRCAAYLTVHPEKTPVAIVLDKFLESDALGALAEKAGIERDSVIVNPSSESIMVA